MASVDDIARMIDGFSKHLSEETVFHGLIPMINKIKFLDYDDREEWGDCVEDAYDHGDSWLPDWVYEDDGLILRAGRIIYLATALDMEKDRYGHSWIYKMERGSRKISSEYLNDLYYDLKGLQGRIDKGEEI